MNKPANIEEHIVNHRAMTDELNDITRRSKELTKDIDDNAAEIQKLMVSAAIREVIYDGYRYFIQNGLQVEKHDGIVIQKHVDAS